MHSLQQSPVLLAIDTCGPTGSVAIGRIESGRIDRASASSVRVLATAELAPKTYAAQLLPAIENALRDAGMTLTDLSGIVVVNGPGSFTGVRVGVSAAKGLAEGANLPVIAVSRLELLACQAPCNTCAALDAGRGEFYVGLCRNGILETESLYTLTELLGAVREANLGIVVCEVGPASLLRERPQNVLQVTPPTAANAISACVCRFFANHFADVATLDGNYLRRPYAENAANQITPAASR
ncbi:MAG TPA: tRNA (adenosine(37)-N6)-threonylcarbamoyltransferase complex dimerization subunit type 1 TsaB [Acidisarcina sp.]